MDSTPAWISAAHGSVLPMDQCCPWISAAPGGLMVWPPVVEPTGGACKLATIRYGGQSVARTIRKVVHPCWTIRLVDNPQVGKTTIHRNFFVTTNSTLECGNPHDTAMSPECCIWWSNVGGGDGLKGQ